MIVDDGVEVVRGPGDPIDASRLNEGLYSHVTACLTQAAQFGLCSSHLWKVS
jgi:hypothetical protein